MTLRPELAGASAHVVLTEPTRHMESPTNHLTLVDKFALWASWAVAGGIFLTLGWMAMAPDDPYGAVSLLVRSTSTSMWLQAAGLAVVVSAIGTLLVGRALPFAGPFAAAIGLTIVSLRGRTAETLLIAARSSELGTRGLAGQMLLEAMAWIIVMGLAILSGTVVMRWCYPAVPAQPHISIPRTNNLPGATFMPVTLALSLTAFAVLSVSMNSREIRHTQVIFVVAASTWLGCYLAFRVVPSCRLAWYLAAVALFCITGYVIAAFQNDSADLPLAVPPSNFLRILPIQFVSVGVAACIAAYWSNLNHAIAMADAEGEVESEAQK